MKYACFLLLTLLSATFANATNYTVSTKVTFQSTVSSANPGDTIIVSNGSYNWGQIVLTNTHSTPTSNWIVIKSQTLSGVVFTDSTYLQFSGKRILISGFRFANGNSKATDVLQFRTSSTVFAYYSRITNITFDNYNSDSTGAYLNNSSDIDNKWVSLYGTNNRVDHCTFINKFNAGATVTVWYDNNNYPQQSTSTYHQIDSNYFKGRSYLGGNGGESIRVGVSTVSRSNGFNIIAYNYFDSCIQIDPEIISNKSNFNTYCYNTFKNCAGGITLREGRYCSVFGNFIIVNSTTVTTSYGIRIIDKGHKVYNNYIEGTLGNKNSLTSFRSPIDLFNGLSSSTDTTDPSKASGYFPADSAIVAFNTIVNCSGGGGIILGYTNSGSNIYQPTGVVLANNLIKMTTGQAVYNATTNTSLTYSAEGNIYNAPSGLGLSSSTGFTSSTLTFGTRTNGVLPPPSLAQDAAVNTSNYASLLNGIDAQNLNRTATYDVGSYELNGTGTVKTYPLDSNIVGAGKPLVITVSIATSTTSICSNSSVVFTSTSSNGGTSPKYQWKKNGVNLDTGATITVAAGVLVNGDIISCVLTNNNITSYNTATSNSITMNVTTTLTPSVSIAASTNNICSGTSVIITATPTNGGSSPIYNFKVNGNSVQSSSSNTFSSSSFANNDAITCVMTSNNTCQSSSTSTSNSVTMNVTTTLTPSVSIAASTNNICSGTSVAITATPTNGGSSPTYNFKVNGTSVQSSSSNTYSSSSFANNDVVTCVMTSNNSCQSSSTSASNNVTMIVTTKLTPSVSITASSSNIFIGTNVTVTATPTNGGNAPTYNFKVNGTSVQSSSSNAFSNSNFINSDVITCVMTANNTCQTSSTATSSGITMTVVTQSTVSTKPALNANGPGNTYELIDSTLGGGYAAEEAPDQCTSHPSFGRHIAEVFDSTLNKYVFEFYIHVPTTFPITASTADNDRCINFDRQRVEIKTFESSPDSLKGTTGETLTLKWRFKIPTGFQASSGFTHIHQIKGVGGDEDNPFFTLSPRKGTPDKLELDYLADSTSSNVKYANVNLAPFINTWVEATEIVKVGNPGTYSIVIKKVSDSTVLMAYSNSNIKTIRPSNTFIRPKWGIYRSLNAPSDLRDESIRFSDIYINDGTPTVTISTATTSICNSNSVVFTAISYNGGIAPTYQWKKNGANIDTGATITIAAGALNNKDTISCMLTVNNPVQSNNTATSNKIVMTITNAVTPSVSIAASTNNICSGTNVTITATPTNGGNSPTYNFKVNGTSVQSSSSNTFSSSSFVNNDAITCVMTTNNTCQTASLATSNIVTTNVTTILTPSVSIAASSSNICSGAAVIITATPTNAGTSPTYNFKVNGTSVQSSSSNTFSSSSFINNDVITCVMTANNTCQTTATATSNSITFSATIVTPSVTISTASTTVCSGSNVTFSATGINAGSSPIYQWRKNGSNAGTGTNITFQPNTLSSGDVISCVLTANNICQTTSTVISNIISLVVKASPSIGTSTIGSSTICNIGNTTMVNNSNTLNGGVWTSSDTTVARVSTVNGASGLVTSLGNGTAIITYAKTSNNGCIATAPISIVVAQAIKPNAISGVNSICKSGATILATTTTGGVWSSDNVYATVSSNGVVTGVNAGIAVIRYTLTNANGCSNATSYNVTVNATPNIPSIAYAAGTINPQIGAIVGTFCANRTFTVVGTPTGGVWSKTGVITVTNPGGVINTGSVVGAASLSYTYTNAAGCSNVKTMTTTIMICPGGRNTSVNEQVASSNEFTIYPNPAKTLISLSVKTLVGAGSIVVTDLYGKQVKAQALSMGSNTVDISNLAKGFYLVSTITEQGKTTKKLIVE